MSHYYGELLLLNATKNRVTFAIADENPFTKRSGRYMGALVPINDDETSDEPVAPGPPVLLSDEQRHDALRQECVAMLQRLDEANAPLLTYAVMLCKDGFFQNYCGVSGEGEARAYLLGYCRMKSRRDINDDGPKYKFSTLYKEFKETLCATV